MPKLSVQKYLSKQRKYNEASASRLRSQANPPMQEIATHREDLAAIEELEVIVEGYAFEDAMATTTGDETQREKFGALKRGPGRPKNDAVVVGPTESDASA